MPLDFVLRFLFTLPKLAFEDSRAPRFEQNVKDYLEAIDKIQFDIVKMLEESMKLNEILQDAVSQRAEQYLEQDNQRQPKNSSQKDQ